MITFFNYMPYVIALVAISSVIRFIIVFGKSNRVENRPRLIKHDIYRWNDNSTHRHLR